MTDFTPAPRRPLTPEEKMQVEKALELAAKLQEQAQKLAKLTELIAQIGIVIQEIKAQRNTSQVQKGYICLKRRIH